MNIVLTLFLCLAIGNPSAPANEAGCRKFVQTFYTWYVKASQKGGFELAVNKKSSFFSPELLRGLKADMAASKKSPGEIVGLDFDPFLNSQEMPDRCNVSKVTRKGDRYMALVNSHYADTKDPGPSFTAELKSNHGQWQFVNFHYGKQGGKAQDLLGILAELKSERTKKK